MDLTYAGRDTVNKAMKGLDSLAPKLINQTSKEVDKIAEARIRQVIIRWRTTDSKTCTTNHTRSY